MYIIYYIPGEGIGNSLQYSCLENPMDKGAWQAIVHRLARVEHDLAIVRERERERERERARERARESARARERESLLYKWVKHFLRGLYRIFIFGIVLTFHWTTEPSSKYIVLEFWYIILYLFQNSEFNDSLIAKGKPFYSHRHYHLISFLL